MKYSELQINVRSMGFVFSKCTRGNLEKNDKNESEEGKSEGTLERFYKTLHSKFRSSHRRCFIRNDVLKYFAKFTRKYLCQSLFFDEVAGLRSEALVPATIIQYYCSPNLLEMDSVTTLFLFFLQSFSKQLFFQHTSEQLEVFILDPSYGESYKITFVCLCVSVFLSVCPSVRQLGIFFRNRSLVFSEFCTTVDNLII